MTILRRHIAAATLVAAAVAVAVSAALAIADAPRPAPALKENLDLPVSGLSLAEDEEEAPEVVFFLGQCYERDAVVFCIDRSSSMAGDGWASLQRELSRVIAALSPRFELGLVFFDDEATFFPEGGRPVRATPLAKTQALAYVASIGPSSSSTCLVPALERSFELAGKAAARRRSILLLSDGKPTCVGEDTVTAAERTIAAARSLNSSRIPIDTVGVGFDVLEDLLRTLSRDSGGNYRRLPW